MSNEELAEILRDLRQRKNLTVEQILGKAKEALRMLGYEDSQAAEGAESFAAKSDSELVD
ncbi:MAG: hypothetical protein K0Q51_1289 [Rickettsiaceae bacterium]|jgi:hypothetical protein|nr:hypothetical protein [Rickettsiaceae bacterium]